MENKNVTLEMTAQEAVFVVNVLGQLPTQSNVYPLYTNVVQQVQTQTGENPVSVPENAKDSEDIDQES